MTAILFGCLALFFSFVAPALLTRARWCRTVPRAALVLWQAVALAAVLSAFSCGLDIASKLLVIGPDGRPATSWHSEQQILGWPLLLFSLTVFSLTLLIGARLCYAILQVALKTRKRRARHRDVVDLLHLDDTVCSHNHEALKNSTLADQLRIVASPSPFAYCLPGLNARIIVSEAILAALSEQEVKAVLAHEYAHLRARHDLVLEAFTAVQEAFPRWLRAKRSLQSVRMLIEMLADDHAVRNNGVTPLIKAILACVGHNAPAGALAVGSTQSVTVERVQRLTQKSNHLWLSVGVYATSAAIFIVPTVAVAIPWLQELHRLLG